MLTLAFCSPPPNLFPFVAGDPSVAVWRISLVCALLLGAETLLLLWRERTLRAAYLPLVGALGCFALALAAWVQSLAFIQDVCATSLTFPLEEYQRVVERARAAIHLNMVYQGLTVAACVATLVLLVWGGLRLSREAGPSRSRESRRRSRWRTRPARWPEQC